MNIVKGIFIVERLGEIIIERVVGVSMSLVVGL